MLAGGTVDDLDAVGHRDARELLLTADGEAATGPPVLGDVVYLDQRGAGVGDRARQAPAELGMSWLEL